MHTKNHPRWDAAQRALAAGKSAEETFAALLGVETSEEAKVALAEQREPDLTMHIRSGVVYALRAEGAEIERLYEDIRDACNRALPVDEAMATINGQLRRELDVSERDRQELLTKVRQQSGTIAGMQMEIERLRGQPK